MIRLIFDLDDTIILHRNHLSNKKWFYDDNELSFYLDMYKYPKYIFTNGTYGHATDILNKMKLKKYFPNQHIYARENYPLNMKPDPLSFIKVINHINYQNNEIIIFFDDQLPNLKIAKAFKWVTVWIHKNSSQSYKHNYVDFSFPTIKEALKYLKNYI